MKWQIVVFWRERRGQVVNKRNRDVNSKLFIGSSRVIWFSDYPETTCNRSHIAVLASIVLRAARTNKRAMNLSGWEKKMDFKEQGMRPEDWYDTARITKKRMGPTNASEGGVGCCLIMHGRAAVGCKLQKCKDQYWYVDESHTHEVIKQLDPSK